MPPKQFRLKAIAASPLLARGAPMGLTISFKPGWRSAILLTVGRNIAAPSTTGTWARSAAGHSQSRVSSQSGFGDIGIMLRYADRQDYAEHEGWRYLVRNQELF